MNWFDVFVTLTWSEAVPPGFAEVSNAKSERVSSGIRTHFGSPLPPPAPLVAVATEELAEAPPALAAEIAEAPAPPAPGAPPLPALPVAPLDALAIDPLLPTGPTLALALTLAGLV